MSDRTKIEWADASWSPFYGCNRVSEGCENCYAMNMAHRFNQPGRWGHRLTKRSRGGPIDWSGTIVRNDDNFDLPLEWKRGRGVFVCPSSDLFHHKITNDQIAEVWAVMRACPQHTFRVLTKRPERMAYTLAAVCPDPLPNVWVGTSVEHQEAAQQRVPALLRTPAAHHWLSLEPILERVVLELEWLVQTREGGPVVRWVVVGGESGQGCRRTDVAAIRRVVRACALTGTPCFVKQLGRDPYDSDDNDIDVIVWHSKGGDPAEWPPEFRVREMP